MNKRYYYHKHTGTVMEHICVFNDIPNKARSTHKPYILYVKDNLPDSIFKLVENPIISFYSNNKDYSEITKETMEEILFLELL